MCSRVLVHVWKCSSCKACARAGGCKRTRERRRSTDGRECAPRRLFPRRIQNVLPVTEIADKFDPATGSEHTEIEIAIFKYETSKRKQKILAFHKAL